MLVALLGVLAARPDRGRTSLALVAAVFLSGLAVPLVLFPGWTRDLVMALPWAAFIQVPADIWLGQRTAGRCCRGLGVPGAWAAVLLLACAVVLRVADRRVVLQGG